MYGYDAPAVAIPCLAHSDDVEVNQWLTDRAAYSAMLKEHLTRAQHRMKQFADKGRTPREFSIGNLVLLKLQSYAQKTGQSTLPKTCLQVFWSFSGSEQGRVYGLSFQVPQDAQVHPVFHVSQLKLFHSNSPISRNPRLRRRRWRLPWSTPNTCARSTGRAATSAPSSPTRDAPRSCSASHGMMLELMT